MKSQGWMKSVRALIPAVATALAVAVASLTSACGGSSAGTAAAAASQSPATTAVPATSAATSASATPSATPSPTPTVDPGTLPQTHAMPTATDPVFAAGVQDLWRAIVDDDPAEAQPFFFPKAAYLQVKAIKNAGSDYQNRLIGYYDLDIHAAHKLLGADAKNAQFVSVTVPAKAAVWITPGVEQNKLSYYRVYGTRLTYTVGGRTKSIGLFSLISWRGVWYIVHLGPNPRPVVGAGAVYQPRG
jgi:hypothetical protein